MPLYNPRRVALHFRTAVFASPGDGTTTYWGNMAAETGVAAIAPIYMQRCRIFRVDYSVYSFGMEVPSGETATVSVRVNDTTDYTVSSSVAFDNDPFELFSNTAMNVPIAEGDYIEFKTVYPTWTTNPTSVLLSATVHIEF